MGQDRTALRRWPAGGFVYLLIFITVFEIPIIARVLKANGGERTTFQGEGVVHCLKRPVRYEQVAMSNFFFSATPLAGYRRRIT